MSEHDWYEGPFDVHPCAHFPREIVRWECPRHGILDAVTEDGCQLCTPQRRLKPRRIVFRAEKTERYEYECRACGHKTVLPREGGQLDDCCGEPEHILREEHPRDPSVAFIVTTV